MEHGTYPMVELKQSPPPSPTNANRSEQRVPESDRRPSLLLPPLPHRSPLRPTVPNSWKHLHTSTSQPQANPSNEEPAKEQDQQKQETKANPARSPSSAPPVPSLNQSSEDIHSTVDVDSPHISSVPSDYDSQSIKTDTQAARVEAEQAEQADASKREKAKAAKDKAAAKTKKGGYRMKENSDNPVVIGNAVAVTALSGLIGYGAYRKYVQNELTWKVVGAWAGVVGLFAAGDYYVSQYFFKKYPPKE